MNPSPAKEDLKTLSKELSRPCLLPLVETKQDLSNPAETYLGLRKKYDASYLLESLVGPESETRYSVLGFRPHLHLKMDSAKTVIRGRERVRRASETRLKGVDGRSDPLETMKKAMFMDEMQFVGLDLPRYVLGITGYLSYDYVRSETDLDYGIEDDLNHPLLEYILPSLVIVFDHIKEQTYYASTILLTEDTEFERAYSEALERLDEIIKTKPEFRKSSERGISTESNSEKKEFKKEVERIKEYIRAGDVIQTVLSRRIDLDCSPDLNEFYMDLREINPSPYMFFLDFPEQEVVGSSPEALVRVKNEKVMTRPIAGTRRRGEDEEDDRSKEKELINDEKERAEHTMLVDLGRNDIGKVSEYGSVDVPEFMEVEKYGHVQHIVSTVEGKLREDKDSFDALKAVFPAGTVTGAPKIRAMEIIEELEPARRGIYSGAIGTFSYNGDADFAITIRTLTSRKDAAQIQVGAGIVADSVPEREYYETENKAESLLEAAGVKKSTTLT